MIPGFKRKLSSTVRAGVAVSDDVVAVALVERTATGVRLNHFAVSSSSGPDWSRRTAEATADLEMRRVPVTAVVSADAYQLVLVECPQVPAEEVASAVRWRIKELVAFPTDEAVIDTIDIPDQAHQTRRPMLYAVAARKTAVAQQVHAMKGAGLALDSIDIPEMCLHNLAGCLPQAEAGVALLHFDEDCGTLILSRAGTLYLVRRIDQGLRSIRPLCAGELTAGDAASDIALELQRSLDYFESHYDQRPITNIVLGPGVPPEFPGMLGNQLGVDIATLDLNDVVPGSRPVPAAQQASVLLAIGAALRTRQCEAAA